MIRLNDTPPSICVDTRLGFVETAIRHKWKLFVGPLWNAEMYVPLADVHLARATVYHLAPLGAWVDVIPLEI